MNWEPVAIGLLSFVCAVLGWLGRELWGAVRDLRRDLDNLRESIAKNYPSYDRMQEIMQPVREQLSRIENALTHKADKP